MPKTSSTTTVSANPATTATPDAPGASPSATTGNLYILGYLSPTVGRATVDVATAIGIGRSTAQKALTALETEGLTRREPGVREGARRSPDLWFDARPAANDTGADDAPLEESQGPATGPVQTETAEPQDAPSAPGTSETAEPAGGDAETAETTDPAPAEVAEQEETVPGEARQPDEAESTGTAEPEGAAPPQQPAAPAAAPDVSPDPDQSVESHAAAAMAKPKTTAKKKPTKSAPAVAPEADSADAPATTRLGHGELRTMVTDHLRAHPERAWTPSAIAKALGGRSAGAVANACEKLLDAMDGLKTFDDAPRRYQYTPPAPPKTKKTK